MQFLVDECTGPAVANWLHNNGYHVFSVFDEAKGMSDIEIIHKAATEVYILITNDKDFGELVFRQGKAHCGVILLRLRDERSANKINVINKVLNNFSESLSGLFVVATEDLIRIAQQRNL